MGVAARVPPFFLIIKILPNDEIYRYEDDEDGAEPNVGNGISHVYGPHAPLGRRGPGSDRDWNAEICASACWTGSAQNTQSTSATQDVVRPFLRLSNGSIVGQPSLWEEDTGSFSFPTLPLERLAFSFKCQARGRSECGSRTLHGGTSDTAPGLHQ